MTMELVTKYLKDYQSPLYKIERTELWIELGECVTVVKSALSVKKIGQHDEPLILNGIAMRLLDIEIDGEHLMADEYQVSDEHLKVTSDKQEFVLATRVEINPSANKSLTGLYKSNSIYCTQCESHGFRNITYHLDRPDNLSVFTVTITADSSECPILLSNGNIVDSGRLHAGMHWVKWHDPHPKPTYLFAMVAGELDKVSDIFTTCSGRKVELEIYVEPGKSKRAVFALACLKKAMVWDENVFNREYDLDKYMIVAVNDFNFGAMENKGLNIFNDKYILASSDTATDNDFLGVDVVVAHEYFHNWSGNRVTCRDWFQLSLKEGLTVFREQKYTEDVTCRQLQRLQQAKIIEEHQFKEDAGPMSHAIRPSSYIDMNNFYTVTVYNKGSEVIRMLETLTTPDDFVRGTDLYFSKFDGCAVTTDDFVDAMQESLSIDLSQFRLWYDQAGTPEVLVNLSQEGKTCKLEFRQEHKPTFNQKIKSNLLIPIKFSLFTEHGSVIQPIELQEYKNKDGYMLKLSLASQELTFTSDSKVLVAVLDNFSAPVIIRQDLELIDRLQIAKASDDGYQKFKQMQLVHLHCIFEWLKCSDEKRYSMLPDMVVEAHESILLDKSIPESLIPEILGLPSESFIMQQKSEINIDRLISVMQHFRSQLSDRLKDIYEQVYLGTDLEVPYHYCTEQSGKRSLRNYCLFMLNLTDSQSSIQLAAKQYQMSDNMTDKMAAMLALSQNDSKEYDELLADFYDKWSKEPLIVDKWLSLQVLSQRSDVLDLVKNLLKHDAYESSNPNRVRALLGTFTQRNFAGFHRADGESYKFLTDQVIDIQSFNPQLAARLVAPFLYWNKFDDSRKQMMLECLNKIKDAKVANCVMEPVIRALKEV